MTRTKHEDTVDLLDQFYAQAKRQILQNQSAITGLFPSNSADKSNASIKSSIWAASSIFALYLAYSKRIDNDQGKAHDLGQSVVKCMRGILFAWMRQSERVEDFKANQSPRHALHLKFDLHSGLANDADYPHLQIDVVSLYLIFLAEFIASGLDIIYCMDEVTFIQNLVYYVERAYRTPDFCNWEPSPLLPSNSFNSTSVPFDYSTSLEDMTGPPPAHSQSRQINNQYIKTNKINGSSSNNQYGSTNQEGSPLEIHATSIGMAKSALEAINGCNLFGGKGANWSIIYSDIDAHSRNRNIFETLLPRESRSKNTDSNLLATISWPCFATHDPTLYHLTKGKILRKLKGKHGLKRFLRDPHGTVLASEHQSSSMMNDSLETHSVGMQSPQPMSRPEYFRETSLSSTASFGSTSSLNESGPKTKQRRSSYFQRKNNQRAHSNQMSNDGGRLRQSLDRMDSTSKMSKLYEHIESEWPLYICFLIIDGIFKQDMEQIYENEKMLYEQLLKIEPIYGDYLMPKYYYVPQELINSEKGNPDTVERVASVEGSSSDQLFVTGQSILLITRLLLAGLVHPNELDPLRRHMPSHDRPKRIGRYSSFRGASSDLVVQTVLIAESIRLQAMMANYGIQTQTPFEVEPVQIWSSAQLVKVYEYLGVNQKLGLTGRPSRPIGALGTSKLYRICGQTILCYPLIFEVSDFYLAQDMLLLIDDIQNELNFIGRYWRMSGRPTVCILIREEHLQDVHFRDLLDLLVQFKNGKLNKSGLRIKTGRLQNLISSSCIEHLDFLHLLPDDMPRITSFKQLVESPKESLLNHNTRMPSFSGIKPPASKNRRHHLASSSSHNMKAIAEATGSQMSLNETMDGIEQLEFSTLADSAPRSIKSVDLEGYSMVVQGNSIDYYECYRDAPTWPTLVEMLRSCTEFSGQSQLLAILIEREGPKFCVDNLSVEDRLESVAQQGCLDRNWSVVRFCSAVMRRSVESLSPWLTSILVNGKQISLGSGANETIISNPLTPTEIHTLIYSKLRMRNHCDAVLQQEIALYIGRLISTKPEYFEGILIVRVGNFMSAMRSYISFKTCEKKLRREEQTMSESSSSESNLKYCTPLSYSSSNMTTEIDHELLDLRVNSNDMRLPLPSTSSYTPSKVTHRLSAYESPFVPARLKEESGDGGTLKDSSRQQRRVPDSSRLVAKPLESLSPSDVRQLLVRVLDVGDCMPVSHKRQITGEICRVPKDFYGRVWSLLSCTRIGIVIGGKTLRSVPILTNMTQDDLNFALRVESMLNAIECPRLRQINVELLVALHNVMERNPEIKFETEPLDLEKIINLSLQKFRDDHSRDDYGLTDFYTLTPQVISLYTVRTVFDCLLPVKLNQQTTTKPV